MKKDKSFTKMASAPEEGSASFRPSIVSDAHPVGINEEKQEEINKSMPVFDGELGIRLPKSLYIKLNKEAKEEGVSLQEYILYKLAGS